MIGSTDQAALRQMQARLKVMGAMMAAMLVSTIVRDRTGWEFIDIVTGLCGLGVVASAFWAWQARGGQVWKLALGVVVTLGVLFGLIMMIP